MANKRKRQLGAMAKKWTPQDRWREGGSKNGSEALTEIKAGSGADNFRDKELSCEHTRLEALGVSKQENLLQYEKGRALSTQPNRAGEEEEASSHSHPENRAVGRRRSSGHSHPEEPRPGLPVSLWPAGLSDIT